MLDEIILVSKISKVCDKYNISSSVSQSTHIYIELCPHYQTLYLSTHTHYIYYRFIDKAIRKFEFVAKIKSNLTLNLIPTIYLQISVQPQSEEEPPGLNNPQGRPNNFRNHRLSSILPLH